LNEDEQILCGADRENSRIQCFNSNTGEFLRQIHVENNQNIGPIFAIDFAPNTNGICQRKKNFIPNNLGTVLFAVTGGSAAKKKVYMINAKSGDILTSFDSNSNVVSVKEC